MVLFKDMLIDTPYPILDIEDRGDDKGSSPWKWCSSVSFDVVV